MKALILILSIFGVPPADLSPLAPQADKLSSANCCSLTCSCRYVQTPPLVTLYRSTGSVFFRPTTDTNIARGQALKAAKNAAVAGDTIHVSGGTFDVNDLAKNGVNYWFAPGSKILYTGTDTKAIFGDNFQPCVCTIGGQGDFVVIGWTANIVKLHNSASRITVHANLMDSYRCCAVNENGTIIVYADKLVSRDGTIDTTGGFEYIHAREIVSLNNYAIENDGGVQHIFAKIISRVSPGQVLGLCSNFEDSRMYIHGAYISGVEWSDLIENSVSTDQMCLYDCVLETKNANHFYVGAAMLKNTVTYDGSPIRYTIGFQSPDPECVYLDQRGLWGKSPTAQPSETGTSVGCVYEDGIDVTDMTTFTGGIGTTAYNLNDIVRNLKMAGVIAE